MFLDYFEGFSQFISLLFGQQFSLVPLKLLCMQLLAYIFSFKMAIYFNSETISFPKVLRQLQEKFLQVHVMYKRHLLAFTATFQ